MEGTASFSGSLCPGLLGVSLRLVCGKPQSSQCPFPKCVWRGRSCWNFCERIGYAAGFGWARVLVW